jgi:hypothetical protein
MSFRENLRRKIEVDRLSRAIRDSLATAPNAVQKVDKESMRKLLTAAGYRKKTVRDLEVYMGPEDDKEAGILVLDNGLGIYRTDIDDVALRKSPTVKEMISIRNVVRILKDDDVLVSKKEASVREVHRKAVDRLDLQYDQADLDELRISGAAALDAGDPDGVIDTLELFAELLDWRSPPKAFRVRHGVVFGKLARKPDGGPVFGPSVVFDRLDKALRMIEASIPSNDPEQVSGYQRVAEGKAPAAVEGADVLQRLMDLAWERRPSIG